MADLPHWKRLDRRTVYQTKYLSVFEDTVQFPEGSVADDYSVFTVPDGVVVVATDSDGKLIALEEYKYAIDQVILNVPAGTFEEGEDAVAVATRELREEAGYQSDDVSLVRVLYNDYPSKSTHRIYIVRAKNAYKVADAAHESTETIGSVQLLDVGSVDASRFDTSYMVSALALTIPEFLQMSTK